MSVLRGLFVRFAGLFGKEHKDRDLAAELESHVQMHIDDNLRAGMTPEEARRQALLKLGGVEQTKESYRDRRGIPWLETLLQDIRFGLRMLAKSPGLTFILVITLALGIGVNAVVFSIVNSFLIRSLSVPHAEQITVLATHQQGAPLGTFLFSFADLSDFRRQAAETFSDVFAYKQFPVGLSADGRADQLTVGYVTGNYFSALGLRPALGRLFVPGEGERPNDAPYVVIAYSYWQTRFGGNRSVIGKQVRINGNLATILGVAPEGFHGTYSLLDMAGYLPLSMLAQEQGHAGLFTDRNGRTLAAMARLKPDVSIAQAQSAVNVIAGRLADQYASTDKGISVRVVPETRSRPTPDTGMVLPAVAALFLGLAGVVLVLVCMNVGNIFLARATARRREMTIRAALGAGRVRLARQILTETILLGLLGGVAGVILGAWAIRSVPSMLPSTGLPLNIDLRFDWRVLAYTVAAALCTGIIVGLWPALLAARTNLSAVLHEGGRSGSAGVSRHRVQRALVIMQVAGSLTLLIVAAVFVRSLERAERMYLGFDPSHVLNVVLDPHEIGYDEARTNKFYRDLEERIRTIPGVQTASLAHSVPMGVFGDGRLVNVEGHPLPPGQAPPLVMFNSIDPAYFDNMRIPLLRGHTFRDSDNDRAPLVAIVNQTMADRFWPGEEPIGKRFSISSGGAGPFVEIVGIAANGKYGFMSEPPQPYFYLPLEQNHPSMRTLQVRSSVPPESLLLEMRQEIQSLAPDLPVFDAETMGQSLAGANGYFIYRFGATMAGVMGLIGLTLAVVGVYGVVSFSTAQRTNELGIRMALGAQRRDVLRLVLRQGLTIVFVGVIAGLVGGWALTRIMGRFAAGPGEVGPLIFGGAALILACVALLACWIPAWRASRVDPMVALRYE